VIKLYLQHVSFPFLSGTLTTGKQNNEAEAAALDAAAKVHLGSAARARKVNQKKEEIEEEVGWEWPGYQTR
jgi:hypothetical protein